MINPEQAQARAFHLVQVADDRGLLKGSRQELCFSTDFSELVIKDQKLGDMTTIFWDEIKKNLPRDQYWEESLWNELDSIWNELKTGH